MRIKVTSGAIFMLFLLGGVATAQEVFFKGPSHVGGQEFRTYDMGNGVTLIQDQSTGREYISQHGAITPRLRPGDPTCFR